MNGNNEEVDVTSSSTILQKSTPNNNEDQNRNITNQNCSVNTIIHSDYDQVNATNLDQTIVEKESITPEDDESRVINLISQQMEINFLKNSAQFRNSPKRPKYNKSDSSTDSSDYDGWHFKKKETKNNLTEKQLNNKIRKYNKIKAKIWEKNKSLSNRKKQLCKPKKNGNEKQLVKSDPKIEENKKVLTKSDQAMLIGCSSKCSSKGSDQELNTDLDESQSAELWEAIETGNVSEEQLRYLKFLQTKCNRLLKPDNQKETGSDKDDVKKSAKGSDKDDAQKSAEDALP